MYLGLGRAHDGDENARDLGRMEGGDTTSARTASLTEKEKVVLDFHYYNYAFCKERRFDARATSTFLSIMKDILDEVRGLRCNNQVLAVSQVKKPTPNMYSGELRRKSHLV